MFATAGNCILRKDELVAAAKDVVSIPDGVKTIGAGVFQSRDLESIEIPAWVETIDKHAFDSCTKLKEVKFNPGIKKIDMYAFNNCDSLTSVVFPDTLKTVEDYAFADCDRLTDVTLGDGIRKISKAVFSDSNNVNYNILKSNYSQVSQYYLGTEDNAYFALIGCDYYIDYLKVYENCKVISLRAGSSLIVPVDVKAVSMYYSSVVYYMGTVEQWKEVEFGGDAKIYYYSATQPSADDENFYWHYDSTSRPVLW